MSGVSRSALAVGHMADRATTRVVDFNRVLAWINAVIAAITITVFFHIGGNEYVDGGTIVLAAALAMQTHLALFVERRRRDPFVILLAFVLVAYFSLRILTLLVFPFSFTLPRFAYQPSDSTAALLFIIAANVFLYIGLYVAKSPVNLHVELGPWRARAPWRAVSLVIVSIMFVYTRGTLWDPANVPRVVLVASIFLGQSFIILMALTYFVVFRSVLNWRVAASLLTLLFLEMLLHTLAGSRSAIVYTLQNVLIVILAFAGAIRMQRRHVMLGLALVPVLALLLVASFTLSTFLRASANNEPFSASRAANLSQTAGDRLTQDYVLKVELPVMLSRAGFFDYSADLIAHRGQYERVVNIPAYLRSIADNVLTPGYDIFDQPKISNSLRFAYDDQGQPSKRVSAEEYQSDQLGIYGELFVLFGYASLPLFFVGAVLFKRVYAAFKDVDPFRLTIKRVLTLYMFVVVINSFGLDWALLNLVSLIVVMYAYRYFFAAESSTVTSVTRLVSTSAKPHDQ